MANKRSKYADFFDNRQKEREMQRAYQSENANDEAASKEQMAMQAALIGGNFDSSDATKNALATYNKLMLEGSEVAKNAGFKPDSQDYDDFVNYFTYMMWPQDSPISYDDFYNANSKRLENIKAQELEAQTKAEQQKVVDFSNAMQQYDTVTGMPLSELNPQSAIREGKAAANHVGNDIGNWWKHFTTSGTAQNPLPQVPNQGDPTLPYMNG